ncbi:hypothetical protein LTR53_013354 [Teratosphaeriaceae sp. CCFEE 6253]|nr:hypothetical protein LTR53_013354 [Teratosphaeriaceae sp. CCFEE 6253]
MPFKPPEAYELDRPLPDDSAPRRTSLSSDSDVAQWDPLTDSMRRYTDDAAQPLRSIFDSEKSGLLNSGSPLRRRRRCLAPPRFCCLLVALVAGTLLLLSSAGGLWVYKSGEPAYGESEPWYPAPRGGSVLLWKRSYHRAAELVSQMTLPEKVNVTTGVGWSMGMCVGNTGPVDRLGFPSLCLQDGPLGLRFVDNATAFPAAITVGASWNKQLMYDRGRAHGLEARLKGINILLGPSVGPLGRLPAGGRNWEGFGADPVLQGIAAARTIRGIQSQGVMATIKHYVGNEQEHFRQAWEWATPNALSSNIDDRTMHELYAWPFAEAVKAGVASVMCSYNQVNNSYACQNSKLLNGILKDELGFQGFVQSDWLAQRSGVASALAGLDMSMPGDGLGWQDGKSLWGAELTKAILNSSIPMERLNDACLRIVAAWYQLGQDDDKRWPNASMGGGPNFSSWTHDEVGELHPGSPSSGEFGTVNRFVPVRQTQEGGDHDELARRIAREGVVLVKNERGILPIPRSAQGLASKGEGGKLRVGIFGEDAYPNPAGDNACADRGCNEGTLASGWGSGAVELPYLVSPAEALHREFDDATVQVTDWMTNKVTDVDAIAAAQDLCLVFINSDAGEGFIAWNGVKGDRNDLYPQKGGDELVKAVAANCGGKDEKGASVKDTVVVLHTVGPTVLGRWIDMPGVKGVLIAHLPGQESGNALADVLFGDYNPSGHLPYTIGKQEVDYGPTSGILKYPNAVVPQQNFSEGLYIDYRYFDKANITPMYEFGYGLSYTSFKLSGMFVHPLPEVNTTEPAPRSRKGEPVPPHLDPRVPDPEAALWPQGLRKLEKYVYPWITSVSEVKQGRYHYPTGYDHWHALSPAGGGEGGNPDLYTKAVGVQVSVTNTGAAKGEAVVQMYISLPQDALDSANRTLDVPVRVLRGFEKVPLEPGVRNQLQFSLTRKDLSYWDVGMQNWRMPKGEFAVCLGFSSRDGQCGTFEMGSSAWPEKEGEAGTPGLPPPVMRAIVQSDPSDHHLELATLPTPTIDDGASEHLIRVRATAPCNNELNWWSYGVPLADSKQFVPCFDLAGTVVAGPADSPFRPGDNVFTRTNAARTGNAAEYGVALTSELAHMPTNISFEQAASVPLSALTAYQALFKHGGLDDAALRDGNANAAARNRRIRLLVTAASGGVGIWILQLAKMAGVEDIVAVCGPNNVGFVRQLGASEVIDYRSSSIRDWAHHSAKQKADLVIDCVPGTSSVTQCWYAVKAGGTLISLFGPPEQHKPKDSLEHLVANARPVFFIMEPRGEQLGIVRSLLESERCRPVVDSVYPFDGFQAAFDTVATGHAKGKVIIKVAGM